MGELDVVCVGSVTLDTIAVVPTVPGVDERVLAEVVIQAGGGPAATAAVALARLGARVGLCGVVGDDDAAIVICAELEREGVVLDWLTRLPGHATTLSCVLVSEHSGERAIVAQRAAEPEAASVPIGVSTWLHVDQTGLAPARRALSTARTGHRSGTVPLLSIDGGNGCDLPDLGGVDLYSPSVAALRRRYSGAGSVGDALHRARADGARAVVATDGVRGAHVRSDDVDAHVPAYPLPVVSTLGAGDVFHGALLAALVRGDGLTRATQEASAAAALSCRAIDGRSGIPTRAELDAFFRLDGAAVPSGTAGPR